MLGRGKCRVAIGLVLELAMVFFFLLFLSHSFFVRMCWLLNEFS